MRRIGAHLSIAGGLDKAVERLAKIGGNCLQVFSASPKSWELPTINGRLPAAVQPAFIHAKYLINLASDKEDLLAKSIASLKYDLQVANLIGAVGVIVHLGSHLGRGFKAVKVKLISSINNILQATQGPSRLIIENSAGQQGKLCSQLSEIKAILDAVNSSRLTWCLDTCHAFNAGYSLGKASENSLIHNDIVAEATRLDLVGYKYSSYGNYLGKFSQAWVDKSEILSYFSKLNPEESYQQFVEEIDERDLLMIKSLTLDLELE